MGRLTDRLAKACSAPASGNRIIYDSAVTGFGLRTTAGASKAFVLNYRTAGQEHRITIGSYPAWSVTAARQEAQRLRRRIDTGDDPMAFRKSEREAPDMMALCKKYIEMHLPKKRPSSQRSDLGMIRNYIGPGIGALRVSKVRYTDIERLHRQVSENAPFQANRMVALLSKMFSLAIKWGWRADNPASGIERNPEQPRNTYLTSEQAQRLARILECHPNRPAANAAYLLMLTGARRSEVLAARWEQFDLGAAVWTKESSHTKQKRYHRVPLSDLAITLLRQMSATSESEFLFPGPGKRLHMIDIKKFWASACEDAAISGVRLHDLRHTFASVLVSQGEGLPVIGALLGHTQQQTTARYAHLFDAPLRNAANKAAAILQNIDGVASKPVDSPIAHSGAECASKMPRLNGSMPLQTKIRANRIDRGRRCQQRYRALGRSTDR